MKIGCLVGNFYWFWTSPVECGKTGITGSHLQLHWGKIVKCFSCFPLKLKYWLLQMYFLSFSTQVNYISSVHSASCGGDTAAEVVSAKRWRVSLLWRQRRCHSKQQRRNERWVCVDVMHQDHLWHLTFTVHVFLDSRNYFWSTSLAYVLICTNPLLRIENWAAW